MDAQIIAAALGDTFAGAITSEVTSRSVSYVFDKLKLTSIPATTNPNEIIDSLSSRQRALLLAALARENSTTLASLIYPPGAAEQARWVHDTLVENLDSCNISIIESKRRDLSHMDLIVSRPAVQHGLTTHDEEATLIEASARIAITPPWARKLVTQDDYDAVMHFARTDSPDAAFKLVMHIKARLGLPSGKTPIRWPSFYPWTEYKQTGPAPLVRFAQQRRPSVKKLEDLFSTPSKTPACRAIIIHGDPGVGKTTLAAQYSHQSIENYRTIWWIPSESAASTGTALRGLAQALGLGMDQIKGGQYGALWERMQNAGPWLLIYDNVVGNTLRPYLPPAAQSGDVIITARRKNTLPDHFFASSEIPLDCFTPEEGAEVLFDLLQAESPSSGERSAAESISTLVGGLLICLDIEASRIKSKSSSLESEAQLLSESIDRILEQGYGHEHAGLRAVFDAVLSDAATVPGARPLMDVLSVVAPEKFPRECIHRPSPRLRSYLRIRIAGIAMETNILECLHNISLIRANSETIDTHRLVQRYVVGELEKGAFESPDGREMGFLEAAIEMVWLALRAEEASEGKTGSPIFGPALGPSSSPAMRALLPHIEAVERSVRHFSSLGAGHHLSNDAAQTLAKTLWIAAEYLCAAGYYDQAHTLIRQGSEVCAAAKAPLPADDFYAATITDALTIYRSGDVAEARCRLNDAQRITRNPTPEGHARFHLIHSAIALEEPDIAAAIKSARICSETLATLDAAATDMSIASNQMGVTAWRSGNLRTADRALYQGLKTARTLDPPDAAALVSLLKHRAHVIRDLGRVSGRLDLISPAALHIERALEVGGADGALGETWRLHKEAADILLDKAELGEPVVGRARDSLTAAYDRLPPIPRISHHPNFADYCLTQSRLYAAMGRHRDALSQADKALDIFSCNYPDRHPYVGEALIAKARVLSRLQRHEEAHWLLEEVTAILRKHFAGTHPKWVELEEVTARLPHSYRPASFVLDRSRNSRNTVLRLLADRPDTHWNVPS